MKSRQGCEMYGFLVAVVVNEKLDGENVEHVIGYCSHCARDMDCSHMLHSAKFAGCTH
jgi:hypothetical protein